MEHPLRLSAMHNLNLLAEFHNHISQLMHDAHPVIRETLEPGDARLLIHRYENDFSRKLRNSIFLMVWGHLEEMLLLLLHKIKPDVYSQAANRSNILKRCRPLFVEVLGDEPERQCPSLNYIKDAYWVRSALIHSSGRIDLFRSESVEGVVRANGASYEIHTKRVSVTRAGLRDMVIHSRTLVDELSRDLE